MVDRHQASPDLITIEILTEPIITVRREKSLEAGISIDIVTVTPSIDFSDHWSKIARKRIRLGADDI